MILPALKLTLLSALPQEKAEQALQAALQAPRNWKQKISMRGGGGFTGKVEGAVFSLRRDINYRNSFLPQVAGVIEPHERGSKIEVRMKMHPACSIFMAVWLLGVGLVGSGLAFHALTKPGELDPKWYFEVVVPAGMLVFGLVMPHAGFRPEAKKAEKFLIETLQAEVELPPDPNRAL